MKINKNILGWFFVLIFSFIGIAYGTSNGSIGNLFYKINFGNENGVAITNEYRLWGSNIIDGTISEFELKNNAVTSNKILSGAVTSNKILNGTILQEDLFPGVGGKWDKNGSNLYYNSGSIGIGTNLPLSKLDVNGNISSSGFIIKNGFIQKTLYQKNIAGDYSPTCTAKITDLPLAVQSNGRCSCDTSISTIDCEVKDLISTDQPGCYDKYQTKLDSSGLNYTNVNCQDLISDEINYFELWKIKPIKNTVSAPYLNYNSCPIIFPLSGTELGTYINDKLKLNSCIVIKLNKGITYKWDVLATIPRYSKVILYTYNMLNGGAGAKAIINMSRKNIYSYNGIIYRTPGRALIYGDLIISGININETIADSRIITPTSYQIGLFNIESNGRLQLLQGQISATEDIVNFGGFSSNGSFKSGHQWYYRNPISPRINLYIIRAATGWNFTGNNGTVGLSSPYIHINSLFDGTIGTGVKIYPIHSEHNRLTYLDDNNKITVFTGSTCGDCSYGKNGNKCNYKNKYQEVLKSNTDCSLGSWSMWSY